MQYIDRLRHMNRQQLKEHIEAIKKQIESRKDMPESAKLDHLFGGSPEEFLKMAEEELREFKVGDIVETKYTNITNTIGKVNAIYTNAVTIVGMEGEVSSHKKERLELVLNEWEVEK